MTPGDFYASVYHYVLSAKDDPDLLKTNASVIQAVDRVIAEMKALVRVIENLP